MSIGFFIALLVCHWAGDFTHLSRPYMLAAKKFGRPMKPIFDHAAVHGALFGITTFIFTGSWLWASVALAVETFTHFWIDVLKGRINGWYPSVQNPAAYPHWYLFGADQFLHIIVALAIAAFISN